MKLKSVLKVMCPALALMASAAFADSVQGHECLTASTIQVDLAPSDDGWQSIPSGSGNMSDLMVPGVTSFDALNAAVTADLRRYVRGTLSFTYSSQQVVVHEEIVGHPGNNNHTHFERVKRNYLQCTYVSNSQIFPTLTSEENLDPRSSDGSQKYGRGSMIQANIPYSAQTLAILKRDAQPGTKILSTIGVSEGLGTNDLSELKGGMSGWYQGSVDLQNHDFPGAYTDADNIVSFFGRNSVSSN